MFYFTSAVTLSRCLGIVAMAILIAACRPQVLTPFTSDGCSAFPDGTLTDRKLWLQCCVAHDLAYWQGGTYTERRRADMELRRCVAQAGQAEIAELMLAGVRVGGTPYLPTSFRWGYGWPYPRGYRHPSGKEQEQIERLRATHDAAVK